MDVIEAAKRFASLTWHVLPVLGKVPSLGDAWQHKTTSQADRVEIMFAANAHDGVGVRLGMDSGIIDVECDSEEAEDTLLELLGGEIPKTPTFISRRGKHFLFRWRDGLPLKGVFKIQGLEFRTGNGAAAQSVFPPSGGRTWEIDPETPAIDFPAWDKVFAKLEENKKRKEFKAMPHGFGPRYGDDETLDVPRWLAKHGREIIGRNAGTDGATRWFIECPNRAAHTTKEAWRDCCVTQMPTGMLGGKCFHQSCGMDSWDALRDAIGPLEYSDYHEPQENLTPVDLSGFMTNKPSEAATEPSVRPVPKSQDAPPRLNYAKIPDDLLYPPGFIGDVVRYTLSTSRYPQPELALAGALSLMAVLTGRKVQDEGGTRTNIYIMGLCPAAAGKEQARTINKEILSAIGGEILLGPESIGSSAGILSVLSESPATLFQLDEIGKMFVLMQNPKAGHLYKIGSELLKLYSSAGGNYTGDAYADTKKIKRISQPHACVYGTSTPDVFWSSLSAENVREGLVGRFLVFDTKGYVEPVKKRPLDIPKHLLERARWWLDFIPGGTSLGNMNSMNYKAITIPFAAGVEDRIDKHVADIHAKRIKEESIRAAIWSRSAEKAIKLALLFACSRADMCEPGVIEMQDADRGIMLANRLTNRMLEKIEDHVADGEHEAKIKKVLRWIVDGMTQSEFVIKTQFLRDRRERNEIVSHLVETGMIACESRKGEGSKPVTILRRLSNSST